MSPALPREERSSVALKPLARPAKYAAITSTFTPVPKLVPVRDEAYRRLVAAMPCIRCGISGYSQAAHPNTGKGAGTKTDDTMCFPLCADRPGVRGCHSLFDSGAMYCKEERRALEKDWSARTFETINAHL